mgnify:CR=1 FL=1
MSVLPGLWDMHAHAAQVEWGPAYLAAGVTTARDMGGEPISLFLKNRTIRCWRIPRFQKQDAPFDTHTQRIEGSPF